MATQNAQNFANDLIAGHLIGAYDGFEHKGHIVELADCMGWGLTKEEVNQVWDILLKANKKEIPESASVKNNTYEYWAIITEYCNVHGLWAGQHIQIEGYDEDEDVFFARDEDGEEYSLKESDFEVID